MENQPNPGEYQGQSKFLGFSAGWWVLQRPAGDSQNLRVCDGPYVSHGEALHTLERKKSNPDPSTEYTVAQIVFAEDVPLPPKTNVRRHPWSRY